MLTPVRIRGSPPVDEFIDDIPFQETQLYVKRIVGTAEDYRYLYGGGLLDPNAPLAARFTIASSSAETIVASTRP
jgi:hypothetical protein